MIIRGQSFLSWRRVGAHLEQARDRLLGRLPPDRLRLADLTKVEIVGPEGPMDAGLTGALTAPASELIALARRQLMDEAAIRDFAVTMLQRGTSGASAHLPRGYNLTRSWFFEEQFFYEVRNRGVRAILVTSLIDRGYAINTVWFIDANMAVAVESHGVDVPMFNRFLAAKLRLDGSDRRTKPLPRRLVTGYPHMLHSLWNDISPVISLAQETSGVRDFEVQVMFEPFGPIERLVPELSGAVTRVSTKQAVDQNDRYELTCGVAGWRITREAQSRIIQLAGELCTAASHEASADFASRFSPVLWVTAKLGDRAFMDEAAVIGDLVTRLSQLLPKAGFILDGSSYPWDFHHNSNYDGFFRNHIAGLTATADSHIQDIVQRLPAEVRARTKVLNGIGVQEEIVWGRVADFYIAHGGSMQHKIGWIHDIPGYIHSNRQFVHYFRHMRFAPLEAEPLVHYVSEGVLLDDDPSGYSPLQLARKDQKYAPVSWEAFYEDVVHAMEGSGVVDG